MQRDDVAADASVARFFRDHCSGSREAFLRAWNVPILVQMSQPTPTPKTPFHTTPSFGTLIMNARDGGLSSMGPVSIHPLAKRDNNPFAAMITVGRAPNNDIVLAYDEVSKFHAFFLRTAGGWALVDAHSTNGTFLGGRRIKPPEPYQIDLGSGFVEVAFSGILAVVYAPERLYELAQTGTLVA
ncbi:MAG TPA: FHA domain-containing protein [Planctomycetota bacterium]|nr:FHA domain-containing protein [Planctomycetota bacterium]